MSMHRNAMIPGRTVTADMVSRIEKIPALNIPKILSDAAALEAMKDVGKFDQMKLKTWKSREMVKAMRAEGFMWDDSVGGWVK